MCTSEENSTNEAKFFSDRFEPSRVASSGEEAMGWCTAQYKMLLFCSITIVKESRNFELAHLKKKENILVTFWFGTFAMLFRITGHAVCHENTQR